MLLISLCAFMWSIGGLFIKILPWHPMIISGLRPLIAAVVTVIYMYSKGYRSVFSPCVLLAGLGLSRTTLFFVMASKSMTSTSATILQSTNPVYTMTMSVAFFHVCYRKSELIAVVVTLAGIDLFFVDQLSPRDMLGNSITLLGGVAIGVMYLFSRKLPDEESFIGSVLLGQTAAAVAGVSPIFFYSTPAILGTVRAILVLGVVQLGVPYVLYAIAVGNCPALPCSLTGMIEPLLSLVWVFLFVGEKPGFFTLLGGAIMSVTVAVWSAMSARDIASQSTT